MKPIILAAFAAAALLGPAEASAGIVVIDGREFCCTDGYSSRFAPCANQGGTTASTSSALSVKSTSVTGSAPKGHKSAATPDDGDGEPHELTSYEVEQIRSGLISESEASSGCGGASAAAGPAGLLPLAVAGLALLRRR